MESSRPRRSSTQGGEFPNAGEMEPGKAFLLIVKEPNKSIDTGAGTSVPTDKPYAIPLNPEWNYFGSPFNFDIPISNIHRQSDGATPTLWFYGGEWRRLDSTRVIEPFEGYAVFNDSPVADTLLIDPTIT